MCNIYVDILSMSEAAALFKYNSPMLLTSLPNFKVKRRSFLESKKGTKHEDFVKNLNDAQKK